MVKIVGSIKKRFSDFKSAYYAKNTFCFPKITKKDYELIKQECELFCETVIDEILNESNKIMSDFPEPKSKLKHFEVLSKYGDWLGPVVKKDSHFFRCVKKESLIGFKKLWSSGLLQVFSKRGYLPKLTISDYYTDDYPIILEQECIDIRNITTLSLDVSKKGLLFTSLIQQISKKVGFALIDPHYFNYTYFANRFVYFDLGSFSTLQDYNKRHDFSMVVLGAYRILFSYFPNSVFYRQDLGEFRYGFDVTYGTNYHEFVFYKLKTYSFCKRHCTRTIYRSFKNIFENYDCSPWDVITCFMPDRANDVKKLIMEIM